MYIIQMYMVNLIRKKYMYEILGQFHDNNDMQCFEKKLKLLQKMKSSVSNIAYEFYFVADCIKLLNLLRNMPVFYQAKETVEHSFSTAIEHKSIIRNHM